MTEAIVYLLLSIAFFYAATSAFVLLVTFIRLRRRLRKLRESKE